METYTYLVQQNLIDEKYTIDLKLNDLDLNGTAIEKNK